MDGDSSHTPTTVPSPSTCQSGSSPEQCTGDLVDRFAARQPTLEPESVEKAEKEPEPSAHGENHEDEGEDGAGLPGDVPDEDDHEELPVGDDQWRRDKKGNLLNPGALYMRFYRRVRSNLLSQHVINYVCHIC